MMRPRLSCAANSQKTRSNCLSPDGCHNDVGLATCRVNCSVFAPTVLGTKEAEMRIIGCDLHARQQTLAMLDTATGEIVNQTLTDEGESVREFYSKLPGPVRVGIEATGSMKWFLLLMEELGIDCQVAIRRRFERPNPADRSTIGEMPSCF